MRKVALAIAAAAAAFIAPLAFVAAHNTDVPLSKRERPAGQTQVAWYAAESSNLPTAWDAAAVAYEGELAHCKEKCTRDALRVMLARRYAVSADWTQPPAGTEPVEMPPRVVAALDATEQYLKIAPHTDDALRSEVFASDLLSAYRQPGARYHFVQVAALSKPGH